MGDGQNAATMVPLFTRMSQWEERVCLRFNQGNRRRTWARLFAWCSRLGDGWVWYALIVAQPLLMPWATGVTMAGIMALCGVIGTAIYRLIKGRTQRPRPAAVLAALTLTVPPLDRFSFPSGHTLHAVMFTVLGSWACPWLGVVLIPFCVLVALSRLVLGLHWPSDVVVGGGLGAVIALICISLLTAAGFMVGISP